MTYRSILLLIVTLLTIEPTSAQQKANDEGDMENQFRNPPVAARPKALWPWVNGNFSLSQITYEMEQAQQKGMGGFDIWDVGVSVDENKIVPAGPPFLSDVSLQGIKHAIEEGDRLGLEIGLISSSSWNAGGSWVKPEHGAMGLFRSDTLVTGPATFNAPIPFPVVVQKRDGRKSLLQLNNKGLPAFYKEVALLAHPVSPDSVVRGTKAVINLEKQLNSSNVLKWNVPAGKWRITRYVCAPTGQPLMIPSPNSNGLMLDHFSAEAQEANLQYIFKRLHEVVGNLKNRSLKYLYEDSYEVNTAVWTPSLAAAFERKNGYSLIEFLPVLDGYTVVDKDVTARFLFDFTKVLSDLIIENHYQKGRELCEKEGLGFYAEAGGPGKPIHNVPFEDLRALGSLTVPRGEFWRKHPQLEKLQIVKGISSAAHIYNQKFVEAEAFTSVWLWQEGPGELKPLADRAMCEGLNRFVYHTFPHTPPESGSPGWVYNFGTLINTTNGWWSKSEGFHQYLGRCSYLLQQGEFVGDVAFYYGDEAPNFVPPKHVPASLGVGYDYDVVNSDAILNRMTVKNGLIYLPHGQFYEILVLPNDQRINPNVLIKLEQMVAAGATIIGRKPTRCYGLSSSEKCDAQVKSLADKLWESVDSVNVQEKTYGKGKINWGKSVREVLNKKGILPDIRFNGAGASELDYIHRATTSSDIYFVRNKKGETLEGTCTFRVKDKVPEWWDAETGNTYTITTYTTNNDGITIPLNLAANGSAFIVFKKSIQKNAQTQKALETKGLVYTSKGVVKSSVSSTNEKSIKFNGPWTVKFEHKGNTPIEDSLQQLISWHNSTNSGIKYFSGKATYHNTFDLSQNALEGDEVVLLSLNSVKEIAEVYLNGKRLGLHWHPAHSFVVKEELKVGKNYLVIEVVNSINNSLIGDAMKPEKYRNARSNITKLPNAWTTPFAEAPLLEAGLLGPVNLQWATFIK